MRLSKAWIVASKDLAIFRRKRSILYSLVIVPILVAVLFPTVLVISGRNGARAISASALTFLLPSFAFFYLLLAGVIPTTLASYSIVGEKVEKCLEPLLATPTTDGEILLGKGIAAFLPPIVAVLGGATLFMALIDLVTRDTLGYLYFPNWNEGIILFVMVPIAAMLSVEWNIIISSRVSDVRIAQQVGALFVLPLGLVYVAGEVNLIPLGDTANLLIIAGILAAIAVLFLPLARATFSREQILTKWR